MNGFASRGLNGGRPQLQMHTQAPQGPALVDSYRHDDANNFQRDNPRYNSMNPDRTQSSGLVDLRDSVQLHLLAETALLDSKEYEIMSQEEVDDLKKLVHALNQKIEQTRANLTIQSKYRDAAISMSKLYSPTQGKRRSILGNRASVGDAAREAEAERDAIQKKCEDLASELWALEKRVMEPQRKLLEHTAGILQMTHKSAKKASTPTPKAPFLNGMPASPESMYTISRDSMEPDDMLFFDEGSLYRSFEDFGGFGQQRQDPIEIPLKSPVREQRQNKQLSEETEKLREENVELRREAVTLRSQMQSLSSDVNDLRSQISETSRLKIQVSEVSNLRNENSDQLRLISDTEQKLDMINNQLQDVIVRSNPTKNGNYAAPPSGQFEPGGMIEIHLDYLQNALVTIEENTGGDPEAGMKFHALNTRVYDVLRGGTPGHQSPPDMEAEFDDQIVYLQDSLDVIESELQKVVDLSSASSANRQKEEQIEAVLMGLWELIQSGYADIQQRKQDSRKTRMDQGLEGDDGMSDTESFDTNEKYSLQAFSTKVQWLYAQATSLKEQKSVLKRQVKQQRELGNKSDGEKDMALKAKLDELEQTRSQVDRTEKEINDVRANLLKALSDLEQAQNMAKKNGSESSAAIIEAQNQLKERNAQVASLEANSKDVEARLAAAEASIAIITAQLKDANDAKSAAETEVEQKSKQVKAKENELDEMTGMVAEFKMRATLAEAELDGAYGSRKERAAELAALANTSETAKLQSKINQLQPRIDELEQELKGTVNDLKEITKQAIDAESKIADLESELDNVTQKAHKEKDELQEALDRERLGGANGLASPSGKGKTSILTDSYRDALRAERKKYDKQLRNEQINRRKLEDELKALKRARGTGLSPLSPVA